MNGYICFYDGKRIEVYAETAYKAQLEAIKQFNPPKSKKHLISVVLAERADGSQVVHTAVD